MFIEYNDILHDCICHLNTSVRMPLIYFIIFILISLIDKEILGIGPETDYHFHFGTYEFTRLVIMYSSVLLTSNNGPESDMRVKRGYKQS